MDLSSKPRQLVVMLRIDCPQVDDDAIVEDAGDDGRIERAKPRLERISGNVRQCQRHQLRGQRASGGAPAADRRVTVDEFRAEASVPRTRCQDLRTHGHGFDRRRCHPDDGHAVGCLARQMLGQRCLERSVRDLVHAQRAHQRMLADAREVFLPSDDDASLRAAEQLVAAEADDIGTRPHDGLDRRLSREWRRQRITVLGPLGDQAAAEILDDRHAEPPPERDDVFERCPLGEPLDGEVGRVDAQDGAGLVVDRKRVVVDARPVRRPYFAQPRARLRHDVGHAEAAANLHQFAARDEHVAAARQRRQHQQRCCGTVVDDDGRFGAREPAQE
jgi:hypothetical protein